MIETFVKRPATTVVLVAFFAILGVVSYFNLAIELFPKMDLPIVTITAEYPGASPFEVETQVVKRIEDEVAELSGIKKLTSRSYENFGLITLEFHLGTDANTKSIEAKDKVEAILNDLPEGAKKPLVEKFDPLATPVVELVLSSDTLGGRTLYEYADKQLKDRLSSIRGVASVEVYGGKIRQINVSVDPVLAEQKLMSITDVVEEIGKRAVNIPAGLIEKTTVSASIRFIGEFLSVEEIGQMELVSKDGSRFTLGEIATIEDRHKKVESLARYNGREAVGLSLKKVSDGNALAIGDAVRISLPAFQKHLPPEMKLETATDTTTYIAAETRSTLINILIGVLLTIGILYLFTGRWRITFISAIVIPSSIVSSFFLMDLSGFTINMATLIAVATSLGTLIANAIVIIESILAHLEKGEDRVTAAINGTKSVTVAVFAAAGTNLVVFTPIAFIGGMTGEFMRPFGLTVVYATLFSLLASFTLTPMLAGLMLRSSQNGAPKKKKFNPLEMFQRWVEKSMHFLLAEYRRIFDVMFRFKKSFLAGVLLVFVASLMLVPYIGNEFFPTSDEDRVNAFVTMPQGSTIEKTSSVTTRIEALFKEIPEVESYLTNVGENGVENASVTANLSSSKERERSDLEIINELVPEIAKITEAEIQLTRGRNNGLVESDVSIHVYGEEYDQMISYSKELEKILRESGFFRSVTSSYKNPKLELQFIPNQAKLTHHGVSYADVGRTLRTSIYGDDSNNFKENGEEYDINVELDEDYMATFDELKQINVISSTGLLPITELGEVVRTEAMPTIWRRDNRRIIQLDSYLSKGTAGEAQAVLEKGFSKINFETGYGYTYVGNAEEQEESNREIGKAFLIAAILTYMLLAAILNSFVHPFTIATSIITSFGGVFTLLFFTGSSINLASMLSMVMLVGLAVNNAILMLDSTLVKLKAGAEIQEALWHGIQSKFRAILMTSLAVIFGAMPQLSSADQGKVSLAMVLIGGMLGSVFFTFLLVPLVFSYLERMKRAVLR